MWFTYHKRAKLSQGNVSSELMVYHSLSITGSLDNTNSRVLIGLAIMDYEPLDNFCAWRHAKPKVCLYIVNIPFVLTKLN